MSVEVAINVRERTNKKNPRIPAKFFDEIHISLKFDSVASTFKLGLLFDPYNDDHAELAGTSHIHQCEISYRHENGSRERLISGFMLSQLFGNSPRPELMQIGGYSRAGLLGDCDIPANCPLESNGLTFAQVVKKVLDALNSGTPGPKFRTRNATVTNPLKFVIKSSRANEVLTDVDPKTEGKDSSGVMALIAEIEGKANASIPKTTAKEAKNALSYLKDIAIQKRLILSHNELGDLVVGVPYTGDKYLFTFDATKPGSKNHHIKEIRVHYDGTRSHSHITVIRQADKDGGNAAEFTIENPLVPIVYRPKVVNLTFGDDITIEQAARNELGNDLKGITMKITLDHWVIDNRFIRPNNTVLICDPKNYLYKPTKWFIESVDYHRTPSQEECTLTCVLPYVYNNETPVNPFVAPGHNSGLE